jgi:hypothetical protein
MNLRKSIALLAAPLAIVLLTACEVAEKTSGAVEWTAKRATGSYSATIGAEPDEVVYVVEDVVQDLGLNMVSADATAVDGVVNAQTAQGKDVTIRVEKAGPGASTMWVRVGPFGDRDLSDEIIAGTKQRLGFTPVRY